MTRVFIENFKGSKVFSIWEVDESGKKTGEYPVVSFGAKKAQAIASHRDELAAFAGNPTSPSILATPEAAPF